MVFSFALQPKAIRSVPFGSLSPKSKQHAAHHYLPKSYWCRGAVKNYFDRSDQDVFWQCLYVRNRKERCDGPAFFQPPEQQLSFIIVCLSKNQTGAYRNRLFSTPVRRYRQPPHPQSNKGGTAHHEN